MGFTESAYPALSDKIKAHMPSHGAYTKDVEDDIVTTLLEELLAAGPHGSSSGHRDVPGAWA